MTAESRPLLKDEDWEANGAIVIPDPKMRPVALALVIKGESCNARFTVPMPMKQGSAQRRSYTKVLYLVDPFQHMLVIILQT